MSDFTNNLTEAGIELRNKNKVIDLGYFENFGLFNSRIKQLIAPSSYLYHMCVNPLIKALRDGDSRIEQRFLKTRANKRYITPSVPAEMAYDVSGDYVDVGRFMSGEPECMAQYDLLEKPVKFLTIFIRCADLNNAFAYYGMILDIIDYLEVNGTRCRIAAEINHLAKRTRKITKAQIQVKDFEEQLNISHFCAAFLSGNFNSLALQTGAIMGNSRICSGVDSQFEYGGVPDQPTTPDTIAFPSAWFHKYDEKNPDSINAETYLQELGIEHIISVE